MYSENPSGRMVTKPVGNDPWCPIHGALLNRGEAFRLNDDDPQYAGLYCAKGMYRGLVDAGFIKKLEIHHG